MGRLVLKMQRTLASLAILGLTASLLPSVSLAAASQQPTVVAACSAQTLPLGNVNGSLFINQTGDLCINGTSSGGGAVTIANGADVTQGAIADSAWVSGSGTEIALLKAIAGAAISTAASSVKIDQTTPGTTNAVQSIAGTTGGATAYHVIAAASDNHVVIKAGAGTVYTITGTSIHSTYQYVRLYDATTGFNGCNSATNLKAGYIIPGATTGGGGTFSLPVGLAFATGISICITGAFSDTDTTNATASVLSINVAYN